MLFARSAPAASTRSKIRKHSYVEDAAGVGAALKKVAQRHQVAFCPPASVDPGLGVEQPGCVLQHIAKDLLGAEGPAHTAFAHHVDRVGHL